MIESLQLLAICQQDRHIAWKKKCHLKSQLTTIGDFPSMGSGNPETSGFKGDADVNDKSLVLLAVLETIY